MTEIVDRFYQNNKEVFDKIGVKVFRRVLGPDKFPFWSYIVYEWDDWWILCFATVKDGCSIYVSKTKNDFILPKEDFENKPNKNWKSVWEYTQPERLNISILDENAEKILKETPLDPNRYDKYLGKHIEKFVVMESM